MLDYGVDGVVIRPGISSRELIGMLVVVAMVVLVGYLGWQAFSG